MRKGILVSLIAVAGMASVASAQPFFDDFDSYTNGQNLHGVGGWLGWDGDPNSAGFATNAQANSAPHSLAIDGTAPAGNVSDLIQEFSTPGTGSYTLTVDTYFPRDSTGAQFFIMLNRYSVGGSKNWSTQTHFDHSTGLVTETDSGIPVSGSVPIVYDQWVPIEMVIDLDLDTVSFSYNGASLFSGQPWSQGGASDIGAVDLWSNFASVMYYDNFRLTPAPSALSLLALGGVLLLRRRR
ncbi:MAG: hypothetical protein IID31_00990 [Planctomycetes bacterium]|nr:hypothetical protein [Planctomycetota bacterium]